MRFYVVKGIAPPPPRLKPFFWRYCQIMIVHIEKCWKNPKIVPLTHSEPPEMIFLQKKKNFFCKKILTKNWVLLIFFKIAPFQKYLLYQCIIGVLKFRKTNIFRKSYQEQSHGGGNWVKNYINWPKSEFFFFFFLTFCDISIFSPFLHISNSNIKYQYKVYSPYLSVVTAILVSS